MNVLKFNEYTSLNENFSPKTLENIEINKAYPTYAEFKKNMINKHHFKFLGTLYCEEKTVNAFVPDGFENVFTERIKDVWGYKNYMSGIWRHPNINMIPNSDYGVSYDDFNKILSEDNIEEITSCKTKTGKTYYIFFNRKKKYFYFMQVNTPLESSELLDLWINIKTKGEDVVYKELCVEEEERKKREEERRRREEEEEREKKKKEEEKKKYKERVETILKKDVKEHPENYKRCNYYDIPKEIRKEIERDDIENSNYMEYYVKTGEDVYWSKYYDVYVNDLDLTDGYVYETRDDSDRLKYCGD